MKATKIYEVLADILRGKTEDQIQIPEDKKELIKDCYDLTLHYPDIFGVTEDLGINCKFGYCYYGFEFILLNDQIRCTLQFDGDKDVVINFIDSENYVNDIHSLDDFMFEFNLYDQITEDFGNVLKPKTKEQLDLALPENARNLIDEAYDTIRHNKKYDITLDPGYYHGMYGFQFETKETISSGEYHRGEIGEYTLGYFPDFEGVFIVWENNGTDFRLDNIEELYTYLELDENDFEQPQGVFEDVSDILKPKAEEDLKAHFEKENPKFVKIFNEMFPGHDYNFEKGEEGLEGSFSFSKTDDEGNSHMFMVNQNRYEKDNPVISYLDTSKAGHGIGGVFTGGNHIISVDEINYFVNKHINPVYR